MDGRRYITSTAVFLNEVIKLAVSLSIALYDISQTLPPSTPATVLFEQLYASVFLGDGWKLAIPAVLYTFQNSLQYIAVSNLDAVHFQILYQLKVRVRPMAVKDARANQITDLNNCPFQCYNAPTVFDCTEMDISHTAYCRRGHCTAPNYRIAGP